MNKQQIKEMQEWIIKPATIYVIESEEEYKLVQARVDGLFDEAITDCLEETINNLNNTEKPNILELNKLVDAIDLWERKR
jgi:hypothetical protein